MASHQMRSAGVVLAAAVAGTSLAVTAAAPQRDDRTIVHVLNRTSYGPRPGDVERIRRVGIAEYIEQQLHPERIPDAAADARVERLTTVSLPLETIVARYERPLLEARRARRQDSPREPDDRQTPPAEKGRDPAAAQAQRDARTPLLELTEHKLLRAVHSERQLQEVLTDFWFNHFNVDARKGRIRFFLTEYEREAIRPHVFGRFADLLEATAKSPAMLFYLDNWISSTDEPQGRGRRSTPANAPRRGLNENYARELLELHTLGVDGGYTQQDVEEVARVFTGWTIGRPGPRRQGGSGTFTFEPRLHEPGDKRVLGRRIRSGGISEGEAVLEMLAHHPSAAAFISAKLVTRFVSDTPPPALVGRASARFLETGGDLREVMRVILTAPEFFAEEAVGAKVKTPLEFVASAVRAAGADLNDARPLLPALQELGMPLYQCQPPTGYKDTADAWTSTGALVGRMNFALRLADLVSRRGRASFTATTAAIPWLDLSGATRDTIARAGTPAQALALTLGSPEFQKR